MVEHHNLSLQQMETAQAATKATQQRHLNALSQLEANRTSAGPSQFPPPQIREWSLEDFLQHHPTKFNGKVSLDEAVKYFTFQLLVWIK